MVRRPPAVVVAFISLVLLSSACGLKQDQKDALSANGSGGSFAGDGTGTGTGTGTGAGGGTGTGTGSGGAASSALGTGTTGGSVGGTGLPGSGSGGAGSGGQTGGAGNGAGGGGAVVAPSTIGKCQALKNEDSTGITPTEIRIGIHAPQTGTGAPLPPSFAAGAAVYWNSHTICGRKVVVDFQDDKYTPTSARAVCGPMSRRDFLVVGAAGTDQIQSCATMPDIAGHGVPYLSAGVTTNGLTQLTNYFAFTLTYAQQASLVLRNAQQQGLGMKKWAVVTSKTNNFKDARDAMEGVLKKAGVPFDDIQVDATSDNGLQSRAAQTGTQIATGGYDTVFLDTSPGYFIYESATASKQGFTGTYTGPGVTMTEVTVAQLVCSGTGGVVKANFLAPYPGIDHSTEAFRQATNNKYDDIYWSLWGLSQSLDQAISNSPNLTRSGFLSSLKSASLPGGVYPPIRFGGGHFGGTGAFSQKMNCTETEPNASQPGAWDSVGSAALVL